MGGRMFNAVRARCLASASHNRAALPCSAPLTAIVAGVSEVLV